MHFIKLILFAIVLELLACFGFDLTSEKGALQGTRHVTEPTITDSPVPLIAEQPHFIHFEGQGEFMRKYPGSIIHTTGIEGIGRGSFTSLRPYLDKPSFAY